MVLLVLALLPFAAGGLVLPHGTHDYPTDLDEYIDEHGRWGVGIVAALLIVDGIPNVTLFGSAHFGSMNMLDAVGPACAPAAVLATQPKVRAATTVVSGIRLAAYLWTFVPRSY